MRRYTWQLGDRVGSKDKEGVIVGFSDLNPIIRTSPASITTASQRNLEQVFGWKLISVADRDSN